MFSNMMSQTCLKHVTKDLWLVASICGSKTGAQRLVERRTSMGNSQPSMEEAMEMFQFQDINELRAHERMVNDEAS